MGGHKLRIDKLLIKQEFVGEAGTVKLYPNADGVAASGSTTLRSAQGDSCGFISRKSTILTDKH